MTKDDKKKLRVASALLEEVIVNNIHEKGKIVARGLFTITIKPRRVGEIHGTLGNNPRYKNRLSVKVLSPLKQKICV